MLCFQRLGDLQSAFSARASAGPFPHSQKLYGIIIRFYGKDYKIFSSKHFQPEVVDAFARRGELVFVFRRYGEVRKRSLSLIKAVVRGVYGVVTDASLSETARGWLDKAHIEVFTAE